MIVINCPQGSKEWYHGRCGAITASMFGEVRKVVNGLTDQQKAYVDARRSGMDEKAAREKAGYKAAPRSSAITKALDGEKVGDYTDAAKRYAFRLAVERLSGELLEEQTFETFAMRRGHELEPEARLLHEERKGLLVEQTGLVLTPDGHFGASVDGLIDDEGISEYKCFIAPSSLMPIILDGDISDCIDQVQGGLWITGRKWAHFVLYCPALKAVNKELTVFEVERDDDYIEALESDLRAFNTLVEDYSQQLKAA